MAPVPNATPEPTTTRVPAVVIVFGCTPVRISARASGPIKATNPSLTRWGMTFIAGGKLISGKNDGRANARSSPSRCREVRVLDEPDQIPKRIGDRRHPNPLPDVLNG